MPCVTSAHFTVLQELSVRLTDEGNLFFLYAMDMSDDDFQT